MTEYQICQWVDDHCNEYKELGLFYTYYKIHDIFDIVYKLFGGQPIFFRRVDNGY